MEQVPAAVGKVEARDIVADNGVPADLEAAWDSVVASGLLRGVLARTWMTFEVARKSIKLSAVSDEATRSELLVHVEGAIAEKLGRFSSDLSTDL